MSKSKANDALNIGFLVFPGITILDAIGPAEVLANVPGAKVHTIWKTRESVNTKTGFEFTPSTSMDDAPLLDVLCIPGGYGINALLNDEKCIDFVQQQAKQAKYVTSVCTGALLLGAAGLLKGRKAATHWAWLEKLSYFGAIPTAERVVSDGNIITGGGVTAGIDFALTLVTKLCDENVAKLIQLSLEYDPKPPFDSGSPKSAAPELVKIARDRLAQREAHFDDSFNTQ
ncbi:DJ-1/PfpI family protein [Ningiella sp. W23]|uniref:DJ-1/PfpI family protein n=1 Tax=Ningiella sp. W23 TaxID=3023715 RepID=UPI003756B693